ncbi:MAG TPA: hypothetical protein VJO33_17125 [Gemmatimonadaceae bacterium]|nr:hypothetical protein [Gemmatimonadaceae bacterium]
MRRPNGMPLGIIISNSIDVALDLARSKYRMHDLTVDNLEPLGSKPRRGRVRYV